MPSLEFSGHKATLHRAIVVSLDLEGFSTFCNQSDPAVAITIPKLIKRVFDCLNRELGCIDEAAAYGLIRPADNGKLHRPGFIKFTGDGALMIWLRDADEMFSLPFCNLVVRTMRDFQKKLGAKLPAWEREWEISKLPKRIRVGIATGAVYALRRPHSFTYLTDPVDYVGYCINLAVRLQSHCRELGFLVHGNLHGVLPGMVDATAVKLESTDDEPVSFFETDRQRVPEREYNQKFRAREQK